MRANHQISYNFSQHPLMLLVFALFAAVAHTGTTALATATANPGIITTFAGNGTAGYSGDGGPAIDAQMSPTNVDSDAFGNIFISEGGLVQGAINNHVVRKIDASTGIITTVVGTGVQGYSGDGGLATDAQLNSPINVAFDAAGNLYVAEHLNHRIRRVDAATGIITTVAGNGTQGHTGDGGAATDAQLFKPFDVAFDAADNMFISQPNHRTRKVDASTGIISTFAGTGATGYSGDGGPATDATFTAINQSFDIAVDAAGNLFIADMGNHCIRKVDAASGIVTTVAGTGVAGNSGDGGPATDAELHFPSDVVFDTAGNLIIAGFQDFSIRKVDAVSGVITRIALTGSGTGNTGDGGPATDAQFYRPRSVGSDPAGNLFIVSFDFSTVRKVAVPEPVIEIGSGATTQSGTVNLPIILDGQGNEFAISGSIHFDPAVFSSPQLAVGTGAPAATTLTQNLADAGLGHVGFLLGLPFGETFAAGSQEILQLQLTVGSQAPKVPYEITFGDAPGLRDVVNDLAETIDTIWTSGTVNVINRNPVAADDSENADEDTPLNVVAPGVLANDDDPDFGDVLSVVPVSATTPGGASISIGADGSIGYDPTGSSTLNALPFGGSFVDTVDYTIDDGDGGSDTATLSVTVAGVNDAPIANDDTGPTTEEHVPLTVPSAAVLGNDSDPDTGDTFSIASVDAVSANGATVGLNLDGSFSYDATTAPALLALAEGANLVDTFTYTIEDAGGLQDSATVSVAVSGAEFEGDVTPRPNGDNSIDVTDAVMIAKFVIGLETPSAGEFSRADTSPRNTGGNGRLTAADWVQTLRYAVGYDAVTRVLGPTAPAGALLAARVRETRDEEAPGNATIAMVPSLKSNGNVELSVNMTSTGQVSALGFSIAFDPEIHRYDAYAFAETAESVTAFVNAEQASYGRLGVVVANGDVGQTFQGGTTRLLKLTLTTIARGQLKNSRLEFVDSPAVRAVSDRHAERVATEYVGASLERLTGFKGLPDAWLRSHFDQTDLMDASKEESVWGADADPDGDGQSNYTEFLSGTSPVDSNSNFITHISKVAENPDLVAISFYPYLENRNYRLLFNSDLGNSGNWISIYENIQSRYWKRSSGSSQVEGRITTIKTNGKTGFFRVEVSLPNP